MSFHLGKPILVLLVLALISGGVVALRKPPRKADLTLWVFADSHYKLYGPLVSQFEAKHGVTVNLKIVKPRAEDVRLLQMFMSDPTSEELPDLCEVVIGSIGKYFRPPLEDIGFVPLNEYLERSGLRGEIVEERFEPWSKQGVIFGVPHDIHPVGITYREDLFRQAGVDLSAAKTWPEFHVACEKFTDYWRAKGYRYRHAMELPEGSAEYLMVMLLQRGINPVDDAGNVYLDDPRVAETLALYAQMAAGPRKIGTQTSQGMGAFAKDLTDGHLCALITADWRLKYVKEHGQAVAGKMRVMPLPVFEPTDKPTSTHGGTCMTMTRACRDRELAWKLIAFLYFSDEGMAAAQAEGTVLPPIRAWWQRPEYHEPDPFFGGQKVMELMTQLAGQIPSRDVTPMTEIAGMAMNNAVAAAVNHVKEQGAVGLEEVCRREVKKVADELRLRMKQMRFEE